MSVIPSELLADYVSHRQVKAVRIESVTLLRSVDKVRVIIAGQSYNFDIKNKPSPEGGWWLIQYEDGYVSFCPPESFEKGYSLHKEKTLREQAIDTLKANLHSEEIHERSFAACAIIDRGL